MRTKLKDRVMPTYTRGEENFNMITHIVGAALGIAALVLGIVIAAVHHSGAALAGAIVFGISMIILYTMSSVYHGLKAGSTGKRVLQVLDHCTIYLLIAGSYTPILLCTLRPLDPVGCWVLFGIIWGLTLVAITLNAIDLKRFRVFSMLCYLGMGWAIIFKLPLVMTGLGTAGFVLLLAGGLCYTIGAVLYGVGKKKKYFHSVFHLFVLAGSICHALMILLFVL